MLSKDIAATRERHFANKKSYVRFDQSEVLYGNDWRQRIAELLARCGGRCEQLMPKSNGLQDGSVRADEKGATCSQIVTRS